MTRVCACGRRKSPNDRHRVCHICRYGRRPYLVILTRACDTREHAEKVAKLLRQVLDAHVEIRAEKPLAD